MKKVQEGVADLFAAQGGGMSESKGADESSTRGFPDAEECSLDSLPSPPAEVSSSVSLSFSACDFILDINNYIPAGSLRVERHKSGITLEIWKSVSQWQGFVHPREFVALVDGSYLHNILQEKLFSTSVLQPYRNLHQAGWIRLEFKMRDSEWGQTRVYILPDDMGNRLIERADNTLRKSLQHLVSELDTARATWDGEWSPSDPICFIDSSSGCEENSDVSLLRLFNTLPSPNPDPFIAQDEYTKGVMENILYGDIEGLTTKMFPYQRRSAAMMLQKESQPALIIDPRLRKRGDQDGNTWYCDVHTGTCLRAPRMYETARGGIMAETMGLGKTLICLALILATREMSSKIPEQYSVGTIPVRPRVGSLLDMSAAALGRTGTPWKGFFSQLSRDGFEYEKCIDAIRRGIGFYHIPAPKARRTSRSQIELPPKKVYLTTATLIVVPANLVRQWESEIRKHTNGLLKVLVVSKSNDKLPQAVELAEYDIVLFSRPRFDKESRDVTDTSRRRRSTPKRCACSLKIACKCFNNSEPYYSPLRDLHFKRLITDEGHIMGNSSNNYSSNTVIVVDFLNASSRWIVSGTPTQGLYGESMLAMGEENDIDDFDTGDALDIDPEIKLERKRKYLGIDPEQERKDLEKLGNIATYYLKVRPWANTLEDRDKASWLHYVMQPRHSSRSYGNMECLHSTLEGMIVRHRAEDIEKDVVLPPLHQKIVYLNGSFQDKLTLNLFSLVITSNAVTSERKDADYLFHPTQRRELARLVGNLRQASFFWSGMPRDGVESAINFAKTFLHQREVYTTDEDRYILQKVVDIGSMALSNTIWLAASKHHEMLFYVQSDGRAGWPMGSGDRNPTLICVSQLLSLQEFVHGRLVKNPRVDGLKIVGKMALQTALVSSSSVPKYSPKAANVQWKLVNTPRFLAGARTGKDLSPKEQRKKAHETNGPALDSESNRQDVFGYSVSTNAGRSRSHTEFSEPTGASWAQAQGGLHVASENIGSHGPILSRKASSEIAKVNHNDVPLVSGRILSTASSKLSYLVSQVVKYQRNEKIIIFYEADNVAYYIAQALEAIGVEHLIYAKGLSADQRSRYLVQFNSSSRFRCLLMDLSQAAFGLDVSSASRVFFVNPVLNKQIEAQAVKRAHRIGQSKPVYVETLVLNGSIEEVIVERRNAMSNDELKRCKTILDDKPIYEWVKNVRFVGMPEGDIPDPDQMAKLEIPQPISVPAKDVGLGEDTILCGLNENFVNDYRSKISDKGNAKGITSGLSGRATDDAGEIDGERDIRPMKRTKVSNSHLTSGVQVPPGICPLMACVEDDCRHTKPQFREVKEIRTAVGRRLSKDGRTNSDEDNLAQKERIRMAQRRNNPDGRYQPRSGLNPNPRFGQRHQGPSLGRGLGKESSESMW